jgi:hypothetical protein
MNRLVLLLCCLALAGPGSASAAGTPLPADWQGVWVDVDSVYDCSTNALIKVTTQQDTLCAGQDVGVDPDAPPPPLIAPVPCSGTADATHIQTHCAASGLCGEACIYDYASDLDATRSGDTAFWFWVTTFHSNALPPFDFCTWTRRHGTRVLAGPGACGAVPTQPSTWGNLRARYR